MMSVSMRRALCCLLLVLVSTAAFGGSADETKARTYLQRPDVAKLLQTRLGQLLANDPDARACKRVGVPQLTDVLPMTPLDFDAAGTLTHGEMRTTWRYTSCTLPPMNVWVVAIPGKPARVIGGLPGNTIGQLMLQRDALMYAFAAFLPSCRTLAVVDTKFVRFEGAADPGAAGEVQRPWIETWTLDGCGERGTVNVHFIPDATGTTIDVPGDEVTRQ